MRALLLPLAAAALATLGAVAPATADVSCMGTGCVADVSVTALEMPAKVQLGSAGELQWRVANVGPLTADGVVFGTNLHAGLALDSPTSDGGPCNVTPGSGVNVECALGSLTAGQSVVVRTHYRTKQIGSGQEVAHAYRTTGLIDGNQTNNEIAPVLSVVAPPGGITKVRAATSPERILKTGGVALRVTVVAGVPVDIVGTVTTAGGPVSLTQLDLPATETRRTRKVFVGTTPGALAKIRRALASAKRLRVHLTVTAGGGQSTTGLYVQK
jgi:hypothetical protein